MGKSSINGGFFIAMCDYQRVSVSFMRVLTVHTISSETSTTPTQKKTSLAAKRG
jgi:hypothetical protein